RFGFVTTNSITQSLNRPIVGRSLGAARDRIHLTYAVPNHPWVDSTDGAAVRVAFTVGASAGRNGVLERVTEEVADGDGSYLLKTQTSVGPISSSLRLGAAVTASVALTQ